MANFEAFVFLSWSAWNYRDDGLHNGWVRNLVDLANWSTGYLDEFRNASRNNKPSPPQTPARPRWPPSPDGFVAISVDAAVSVASQRCGVGGVVRTASGAVLSAFAYPVERGFSPLVAELWAILRGVELARDRGFIRVVVQSDCSKAISLIN